jgi:threonine dehydratase
VESTAALGAEIVTVGPASTERLQKAEELAQKHGYVIVPPYNDEQIIAGQGTVGLEILEDCPDVDLVLVPSGGGGLISGVSAAIKLSGSKAKVIGVEPELANDAQQSFRKGEIVELPAERVSSTLADGLRTQSIGPINFEHIRRYVDDMITVTEDEIRSASYGCQCPHHQRAQRSSDLRGLALPCERAAGIAKSRRGDQRRQRRSTTAGAGVERSADGIE